MMNLFDLKDKNILFTAGSSYLGSAMVEGRCAFGANVVITGRNMDKCQALLHRCGNRCHSVFMDVTDEGSIKKTCREVVQQFGSIDVLVNNANFSRPGAFEKISGEDFAKGIDGTINSVFRVTSEVLRYMLKMKRGSIINIASMYGLVAPNPDVYGDTGWDNPASYGAGKAAIIQLTRYLACTYGRRGIRVNCISPGPFPSVKVQENSDFVQRLSEKTPLGRIGKPEELKGVIVFLASEASSYVTGQNISVDGGWTAW
mgnify:CR=1 FL=1